MLLKHQNIENVEQFDKTMESTLRQKKMQYLASDMNYQLGFNHAWVALQGTVRESVIDNKTYKQLQATLAQLKAENATLSSEVIELKEKINTQDTPTKPVAKPRSRSKATPKTEQSNDTTNT